MGKKKQASYRVVVADQNAPRDGDFVEIVGHYNPRTEPSTVVLKEDRVKYWLSQGARPTDTVHHLIHKQGIWDVAPPKRPTRPSKVEQAATAAAAQQAQADAAAAEQQAQADAAAKQQAQADAAAAEQPAQADAAAAEEQPPATAAE
jgi:small subunit ribosomal protein S16